MQSDSEDQMFVNRCLEGDWAAFAFLVDKYKEVVHAYAYHRTGDHQGAQDISQEVFIKAYRKLGQLKWPHRFRSWLYTIASNECKMWHRKHSKGQEIPLETVPVEELDELAVRNHSDEDIRLTVRSAMEALPDANRLVLSLHYMSGQSVKEIAEFMGISPSNVKVRLHRAREQLGERLENMIGKQMKKEKMRSGFVMTMMNTIKGMPIPSLPKPRPIRWAPIPVSIGLALLIGIIGYGFSSGKDVSPDVPTLKQKEATFEVSLLPDTDRQTISHAEPENINNLVAASVGDPEQTEPTTGTKSSGVVVRQIWEDAGDLGAVSPDGRYISYVNWDNGNLGIHDLETGENREVTDEGNWDKDEQFVDGSQHIKWSPDSKQIAYLWDKGEEISLRIVGIDGSEPRVLCNNLAGSGLLWAWSPDGKYILASQWEKTEEEETEETEDIVLVSVVDGSIRFVKSLGPGHSLIPSPRKGRKLPSFRDRASWMPTVRISSDNRYVAYDSIQNEDSLERDIFLFAADGDHEVTLVGHPADDFDPFWSPDGERIVFVSDRSGSLGLWVLEVVDGKPKGSPQLINDNLNGIHPLGLTQDGSYYYRLPGRENDIYFADLDSETRKVLGVPYKAVQMFEGRNSHPHLSPDGKRLVYVSRRGTGGWRSYLFVIHSLETGEESELQTDRPLSLAGVSSEPRWAPDGRSILSVARANYSAQERRNGIHQIHADTGAVTHLVWDNEQGGVSLETSPVWSPDGSKMFFIRGNSIKVYDFEAERERSLRLEHGDYRIHAFALSPDGQQLAFLKCSKGHSIQIASAAGGEMREILRLSGAEIPPIPDGGWLAWMTDGRHLLFARRKDEATELWRIPVEGGKPENLGLAMGRMEHLSIHPDGRRIAFTGPGPTPGAEVWVMENILPASTASR